MAEPSIETIDPNFAALDADQQRRWYDARSLTIEGRGWDEPTLGKPYRRLPARCESLVRPPVWDLAQHSAGITVRFVTDSDTISVRWTLNSPPGGMMHMPRTGKDGIDLYAHHDGAWRFAGITRPIDAQDNERVLIADLPRETRQFLMHLPLYNGVEQVAVGVADDAAIAPAPPRADKPIVCYGTSIVQGGCAARPGMAYPAILGRMLDRETLNLGFSGNGQAEPEVAELLAELDPALYLLDPLPNLQPEQVAERIEPFVHALRRARPATPIVLVESIHYTDGPLHATRRARYTGSNAQLRAAFDRLRSDGVDNIHLVAGDRLLGDDGEATVDGTHPTDLGFQRQAETLAPVICPLLQNE